MKVQIRPRWFAAIAMGLLLIGGIQAAAAQAIEPTIVELWPQQYLQDNPVRGPEVVGREGASVGAVSNISNPRMEIYRPARPNGTAALILGGGGYFRIQIGTAAQPTAQWLASLGVTTAVLYYRMPGDGWKADAPFQDAQRAMRILRSRAGEFAINPDKLGVIGFSAGGNLAGITATRFDHDFYAPIDAADKQPSRPDFLAMIYPVVTLAAPLDTTRSRRELGTQRDAVEAYSVEKHVRRDMPPVFLAHAVDDPIANVGHSLLMFDATRAKSVPVEMHIFDKGRHSWGLGAPGSQVAAWPRLFATWARSHGFIDPTAGLSAQPMGSFNARGGRSAAANKAAADDGAEDEGD